MYAVKCPLATSWSSCALLWVTCSKRPISLMVCMGRGKADPGGQRQPQVSACLWVLLAELLGIPGLALGRPAHTFLVEAPVTLYASHCAGGKAKPTQADRDSLSSLHALWVLLAGLLGIPGLALGTSAQPLLAEAAARTCLLSLARAENKSGSTAALHHGVILGLAHAELVSPCCYAAALQ